MQNEHDDDLGEELKEQALDRVAEANARWIREEALPAIQSLDPGELFTTDEVWALVDDEPGERRAMGAAIRKAAAAYLIELVPGEQRKSSRPDCHRRPVQVWRRTWVDWI